MNNLVYGVGLTDIQCSFKKVSEREYNIWLSMLSRCYDKSSYAQKNSYIGCVVSDDWLTYSNFRTDIQNFTGFNCEDWQLDKDILLKGNKVYSKETCCFVPREINSVITTRKRLRGELPIGVVGSKSKSNPYKARCSRDGKIYNLGSYSTPLLAFNQYKIFKEETIRLLANKWKNELDDKVYDALINYEVSIED